MPCVRKAIGLIRGAVLGLPPHFTDFERELHARVAVDLRVGIRDRSAHETPASPQQPDAKTDDPATAPTTPPVASDRHN